MEAADYDAAELIFLELPSFRESDRMVSFRIPYLRAQELLHAAEEADTAYLPVAGLSETDVDRDHTVSMLLYQAAAEAFDELKDYEDSAALAQSCRDSIALEQTALKQADYDAAAQLLSEGSYSEAAARFAALGSFSDSEDMVLECRYRKALSLFHFLCSYDVSRISAKIAFSKDETSIFSLPESEALRLGSGCISELRAACGNDPTDVRLEEEPSESLTSLKEALTEYFVSLGNYADSASYPDRIEEETDYTREFFMLCETGDLYAASNWLLSYEGSFPERDVWKNLLITYLPYCANWSLYMGDPTLLPYTIGQKFECMSVSSRVLLTADSIVLRLAFGDDYTYTFDLSKLNESRSFMNSELDNGIYLAYINAPGHLAYQRFDSDWNLLSSCEYELS